jgi:MinD-like ATPase involved in chromosome partitioning or flagellar assembly
MTIICEPDAWAAQVLAAAIGADARTVPALSEVPRLLAKAGRCPVVIGSGVDLDEALRFTARLAGEHPDARVVLVRRLPSEAETVRATAAGVFAVVDVRAHDQIAQACSAAAQPDAEGQVLAVFAARAGYGKTTLATNLAVALRADGARRVCLLDLDLDCGDIASVLDLSTTRTLAQLIGPGPVGELLASGELVITSQRTGLDCILAPVAPGDAERIRPARIGQLLRALANRYDAVVVDLPARFSPTVLMALDNAHHHILVAAPERPALKSLRQTLDILDLLGYSRAARSVLFNRSDPCVAITAGEVAAVVRGPIAAHVPTSRDVPASINRGVPLLAAQPGHPVSVAIQRFAERYAPVLPASGTPGQFNAATAGLAARHTKGENNA